MGGAGGAREGMVKVSKERRSDDVHVHRSSCQHVALKTKRIPGREAELGYSAL